MKKVVLLGVTLGFLLFAAYSCGYAPSEKRDRNNDAPVSSSERSGLSGVSQNGAQIYREKCVACHQTNGLGITGTFPPLKGSDFLKNASKKKLIEQVMKGSNGGITVNGVTYNTSMPPQVNKAGDAVAVVNYILNAWGNDFGKATLQDAQGIKPSNGNRHMMNRGGMGRMGMRKMMPSGRGMMMGHMK